MMEEQQEKPKKKNKNAGIRHGVGKKSWGQRCAPFSGGLLGFYFISVCLLYFCLFLVFSGFCPKTCLLPMGSF